MNVYLVLNNNSESRFVICAHNVENAYKIATENGRAGEVFDRSFMWEQGSQCANLLGGTDSDTEKILKEI